MPNLKEGMYSINTFSEGMNMDVHPSLAKNSTYQYAENIRIVTNDDGSTGVACNYDGVETIYDMRIFHVDPDKKTDDGKYTPSKNDERIIHVDSCRQYAVVFTRERISGSDAHIDRIYLLDFTKDPKNRPVFNDDTCRTALGDLYRNSNKTLLRKNDKTGKYEEISTNVVYENETSNNPSDDDINNRYIPLDRFSGTTWKDHFFCTLVRVGEYGIHQPVSSTMMYESDTNVKIYWADGYNQIQTMNIIDAYKGYFLKNNSKDATSIVPMSPYNSMFLSELLTNGGLKTGVYRYTYVLTNAGGAQSGVALPTGPIVLYENAGSQLSKFSSGKWAESQTEKDEASEPKSSGTGIRLKVFIPQQLLDQYDSIRVIRIYKPALVNSDGNVEYSRFIDDIKLINAIGDYEFDENGNSLGAYATIENLDDSALEAISDITAIYDANSALSTIFMPRFLEQKDNILFAANVIEPETNLSTLGVSDNGESEVLDFRSYPFNRYGYVDLRDNSFRSGDSEDDESWRMIETKSIDDSAGESINYINVGREYDGAPVSSESDCYIPYDNIPSVEICDKLDRHNKFFNYGFDKTFNFHRDDDIDPFSDPENAGKYWIGGCGPIVSYEFVTKEVAISDNKTFNQNGLEVVGGHQLSHDNARVFSPKTDGDWGVNDSISVHGEYIPVGTDGKMVKFGSNKLYNVGIEPDFKAGCRNAGGYNNPFIIEKFRSLKRDEVYRYIISFRTSGGKRCASFWIGDIRTPSSSVIPYFTVHKSNGSGYGDTDGDGSMVFANVLGIKFKFDIEVMKAAVEKAEASFQIFDSFEILRAQRSSVGNGQLFDNKTVIATGVLQSLFHNVNAGLSWDGVVSDPVKNELDGNSSAYYYDDKVSNVNPTWFPTTYGDPECFFPSYIRRPRSSSASKYKYIESFNDRLNNLPYRVRVPSDGRDTSAPQTDITLAFAESGDTKLYSRYTSGIRNARFENGTVKYGKSTFGSLFPASRRDFGIISPEFDFVMRNYRSEGENSAIDVTNNMKSNLNNALIASLADSYIVGNTSLFSAVNNDTNRMYADMSPVHIGYGRNAAMASTPLLALFSNYNKVYGYSQPIKTNMSSFRPFASIDVLEENSENDAKNYELDWYGHPDYDGGTRVPFKYSAVKSAGYAFPISDPYYSKVNGNISYLSTGGISTGCCDGLYVHGRSTKNLMKSLSPDSSLKEIFEALASLTVSSLDEQQEAYSVHLATLSGGQNMVGRYYYQTHRLRSRDYEYVNNTYTASDNEIESGVSSIKSKIRDYNYASVVRTDRGRIDYGAKGRIGTLYADEGILKRTDNTSIFTYMYIAPYTLWYEINHTELLSDNDVKWIMAAVLAVPVVGLLALPVINTLLAGTTTIDSAFNTRRPHGQHMISLTGCCGSTETNPDIRRSRTSPSHGNMVYVSLYEDYKIPTISGCYAESLLDSNVPNTVSDVMNYTSLVVVDVKIPFDRIGLNKVKRSSIQFAPAGGALIPLESDKFDACRTSMSMTEKRGNMERYPTYIEQTIFSGDEYICVYDYTSTYLTRANGSGDKCKFGAMNNNKTEVPGADSSKGGDCAAIAFAAYNGGEKADDVFYESADRGPLASVFTEESISAQMQALIPIETQINISLLYGYKPAEINALNGVSTQKFSGGKSVKDYIENKYIYSGDYELAGKYRIGGTTPLGLNEFGGINSLGRIYTSVVQYNKKNRSLDPSTGLWRLGSYYNWKYPNSGSTSGWSEGVVNGMHKLISTDVPPTDQEQLGAVSRSVEKLSSGTFDTRIRYSATKTINESDDAYTNFLDDNKIDVDSRYGPITGLYRFNNSLYFWQDSAFASISVNEKQLIQDDTNTNLLLGTGDVLKTPTYITIENGIASSVLDNYGIKNYASGVYASSDSAIYWYDHNKHEVLIYKGGVGQLSKMKGFQSWLNKYHDGFNAKLAFTYNPKYKEILMTFTPRDDMYYRADKAVQEPASTIVYSELIEAPTTFVTNNPTFYTRQFNDTYSFDKTAILRRHNVDTCVDAAKIRFVANESPTVTKVFDNVEYSAEFREPGLNFTTINFETSSMVSNNVEFIGRREDNYRFAIPRAKSDSEYMYPNRMKGKYIIENFEFNNGGGEFKLPSVITTFRSSYI